MYADDTNIITITVQCTSEGQITTNYDLENIKHWLLTNKLSLNTTKTEYMIIALNYKVSNLVRFPVIRIGNSSLKIVHISKSLGLYIDDKLS